MKTYSTTNHAVILDVSPSTSPYRFNNPDVTSWDSVHYYTEACVLTSSVRSNDLYLHTASFTTEKSSLAIVPAGKPGTDPKGVLDAAVANGAAGRSLWFSSFDVGVDNDIRVVASGGDAANGTSGVPTGQPGGPGGNGGKGGHVNLFFIDKFRLLYRQSPVLELYTAVADRQAALQSWATLVNLSLPPDSPLLVQLNNFMASFSFSSDGVSNDLYKQFLDNFDSESFQFGAQRVHVDVQGGQYGVGGKGIRPGKGGTPGSFGTVVKEFISDSSLKAYSACIFHPEQVAMAVRDIENNYMVSTTKSLGDATLAISALKKRLSILDNLTANDNLWKAYASSEANIFVIPSGTSEPASITSLKRSLQLLRQYGTQLAQGLDFYDHERTWVPSGSFEYYRDTLGDVLNSFTLYEHNYKKYIALAGKKANRKEQLDLALKAATLSKSQAAKNMEDLQKDLDSTGDKIAALQSSLPAKRKELDKAIIEAADNIQNSFSVSLSDFITAASQFAFAPGLPMGVIQGASLLNESDTQVSNDQGLKVTKDYVVSKLAVIKKGLDGLDEAVASGDMPGTLQVDDPKATKLVGLEQDIMDLIGQYRTILGSDTLASLQSMFDDYVHTALFRNTLVLHWNSCITVWLKNKQKVDEADATSAALGRDYATQLDCEVPAAFAAIERSYFDTTYKVLRTLYETQKSLSFWSLDVSASSLDAVRQLSFPAKGLSSALHKAKDDILGQYKDAVGSFMSYSQPFGDASLYSGNTNKSLTRNSPIRVYLTESQVQSLCLQPGAIGGGFTPDPKDPDSGPDYSIIVNLPPVLPTTQRSRSNFAGYADVRLTKVRVLFEGAVTDDGELVVDLEHLGREVIVDPTGMEITFTHNPVIFKFDSNLISGTITTDGDIEGQVKGQYAMMGPFAPWRITVTRNRHNSKVDLSKVTKVYFEFHGWSRSFYI